MLRFALLSRLGLAGLVGLLISPVLFAAGISATNKYAWSENAGWLNFNATHGNVQVYMDHLEGFVWAENLGWIRLGSHTGGGAYTYANTSNTTYGVNHDGNGHLSGYAWSENAGWINFQTTHGQVTIDANGVFDGYAWSENVGYLHFRNTSPAYQVAVNRDPQTITHFNPPTTGVVGGSATLSATGGGSGNPVVFGATPPAICTVSGATIRYGAVGTCTVTADQAGGPLYLPASISRNIDVQPNSLGDPTAIPTLSEWALGLMSLLFGFTVWRSRRREPF
ncbi:MAG: IPTL-CTERM sorting domain-containing protein [Candidatus Contendobacter sp.]|nr:IPTL-CTERM sorting domain-containing protein [Candidatus Contendobacter sp.]MDS4058885.1 IPTL-CTERM sorting domain-containing protein [Candidatus Contendobacter sp.]